MRVTQQPITTSKMAGNNKQEKPAKLFPTLFKGLINNDACVTAAKKFPWWIALIIYVISVCISFIPAVVTSASLDGNYLISQTTYSADIGLETFTRLLNGEDPDTRVVDSSKEIKLVIKPNEQGENELVFEDEASKTNWDAICTTTSTQKSYYEFRQNTGAVDAEGNVVTAPRLRVFLALGADTQEGTSLAYEMFFNDATFGLNAGHAADNEFYAKPCSILVLGSKEFYFALYNISATTNSEYVDSAFKGDYLTQNVGENGLYLKDLLKSQNENVEGFVSLSQSKWNEFFNEGYKTLRKNTTTYTFFIVTAMNAVIVLIFGGTLFLMTRGKNNPNKHFKFVETLKLAFFASLAPAILTLVAGFIWTQYASFAFVALMSIRLMWLSMKTLRPIQ